MFDKLHKRIVLVTTYQNEQKRFELFVPGEEKNLNESKNKRVKFYSKRRQCRTQIRPRRTLRKKNVDFRFVQAFG